MPRVLHWGSGLGRVGLDDLEAMAQTSVAPLATNGVDAGVLVGVLPESGSGWTGTPAIQGHRAGRGWSPRLRPVDVQVDAADGQGGRVLVAGIDTEAGLEVTVEIEMLSSGLVRLRSSLTNEHPSDYVLNALLVSLPVPSRATEVLDLAGRWAKERVPQRRPFTVGAHVREGRHGRTGADAATVLTAGEAGFDFESGETWGVHVAFSGNHVVAAERAFSGERLLSGGELLLPGEVVLADGETYRGPWVYALHGHGLDTAAAVVHRHLRSRPHHPSSPRPVVMNVWEAVYFDHDLDTLLGLADLASSVGVERFVLDDGWFGARRDDTAGLGDWWFSPEVWGDGRIERLVSHVKGLGMEFGLWFEPEMVNPDSDLARSHPDWLLQVPGRLPVAARSQQVLNLAIAEASAHVRQQIVSVVHEIGVDFIKWDHNRDLVDAGSTVTGAAGVHAQTHAAYALIDEIRALCPGLEIESCSSGGARVDLEIIERTDRVWASDCIDAHERQTIQRWTAQLLPPELVGSHVGAGRAHTTGRQLDLDFRAATALFGHFGIEWDLASASEQERADLAEWVTTYKRHRHLIHTGSVVRRDLEDGAVMLIGAVAPERSEGLYSVAQLSRTVTWPLDRVRLPGLDPAASYQVTGVHPRGPRSELEDRIYPRWWWEGVRLPGAVLSEVGIHLPALDVDHACLVHVERQS
ncbi:alpha-galactosidase [Serinibacter arcticus]|uniref:alpha-galactosidase n=1 Tax=Serinibacter arcticus TaxID=1655435 RepID=UPI00109313A2